MAPDNRFCRKILVTILAAVAISGCTKPTDPKHKAKGRYYDSRYDFSIALPFGWMEQESSGDTFMKYERPIGRGEKISFRVSIFRVDNQTIEQHMSKIISYWSGDYASAGNFTPLTNWQLTDKGFVEIDGKKSFFLSANAEVWVFVYGKQKVQTLLYGIIGDQGLYLITFHASPKTFNKYRSDFEAIAMTGRVD